MTSKMQASLVTGIAAIACLMSSTSAAAQAASAASAPEEQADEGRFGDIVVTAQRRTQRLQDVPIAAAVLTGDMLAQKGVEGITSLQYAAPGLTVADYGSANVLNIRGIGRSAVDIELPSGVVIYRDGVPTFPGYFQNEPYYDIGTIEVLRGPQGTFVGKSAAGGAIFVNTAAPDLSGFKGRAEAEAGNYDQYGFNFMLNAPLSDTFAVRVAGKHFERHDILADSLTGNFTGRPGRPNLDSIRFGAKWVPDDAFSADFRLDLSDLDFGGTLTSSYGYPLYDFVQNATFAYRDRSARAVMNLKYNFENDLVLNSVTGYQGTHTQNDNDHNGALPAFDTFDSKGVFKLYSQEFNLVSPDDDAHAFSYVVGVFAQRTDSVIFDFRREGFNITGSPGDLGGLVQGSLFPYIGLDTPYKKREDEWSGFVDVKYKFSPQFDVELGMRYSHYMTKNETDIVIGDGLAPPSIPFYSGTPKLNENDLDGKLALSYRPNSDHNIFLIASRAHVTGGFNLIGGAPFKKEIIYSYEGGWKANWAGGAINTQIGAYYQTFSKYQAQFINADFQAFNNLQNAIGKSEVYGFEASAQARLGNFSFDASLALLRSKLGTYPNVIDPFPADPANPIITISGAKTPFAPEFSVNATASYKFELSEELTATPRIDVSHQSKQGGALIIRPTTQLPGRTLINAGLRFEWARYHVDFWTTNLTDERFVVGIQNLGGLWYPAAPRQYGVRVGVEF